MIMEGRGHPRHPPHCHWQWRSLAGQRVAASLISRSCSSHPARCAVRTLPLSTAMKKMAVADAETRGLIYEDGASSAAPGGGNRVLGLSHRSATAAFAGLAAAVAVLAVANLTLLLGAPPAADATAAAAAAAAPSFGGFASAQE
jgi:hypothetical protein